MPDITGYSLKEVISLSNILNLKYKFNGNGFVTQSSIAPESEINKETVLEFTLEEKKSN